MKPFVLFIFDAESSRLAQGGMDDHVGSFESIAAAKKAYTKNGSGDLGQIAEIGPDGLKTVLVRPSSGWRNGRYTHLRWRKVKS